MYLGPASGSAGRFAVDLRQCCASSVTVLTVKNSYYDLIGTRILPNIDIDHIFARKKQKGQRSCDIFLLATCSKRFTALAWDS